jgi:hypothetical protein
MKNLSTSALTMTIILLLVSCDPSYNKYDVSKAAGDVTGGENQTTPFVATPEITPEEPVVDPPVVEPPKKCELTDRLEPSLDASLSILDNAFNLGRNNKNRLSYYLDPSKSTVVNDSFLVDQIDTPARSYLQGVPHLEHEMLIDPRTNNELNEYYSISYNGYIHTDSLSYQGTYQIALLSDDGVVLSIDGNKVINNPTDHAPTFNCAQDVITFEAGKPVSLKLDYYQGPRSLVANSLMWRKIDPSNVVSKTLCEKKMRSTSQLEANGWEVIPREVLFRDLKTCE